MTDLICKNTMRRCQTPGMCSPFGGCREVEPVSSVWLEQLRTELRATIRERDQLKAENEQLRGVMAAVVSEIPHAKHIQPGNAPGHSHRVPGVWDEDNGAKAGKECGWCKVWNTALDMAKEANHD